MEKIDVGASEWEEGRGLVRKRKGGEKLGHRPSARKSMQPQSSRQKSSDRGGKAISRNGEKGVGICLEER